MSNLVLQLLGSTSNDGKVISIKDITPSDNILNSANYWDGNSSRINLNISKSTTNGTKPDKVDITDFLITLPTGDKTTITQNSGSTWVPVNTDTLDLDTTNLGSTISGQNILDDGVYEINYYLWSDLSSVGNYSITTGTQIVTFSTTQLGTAFPLNSYIRINGTSFQIIEILSSTTAKISSPYTGTTQTNQTPYIGFTIDFFYLNTYNAECCIQKQIATLKKHGCCDDCQDKALIDNMKIYSLLRGALAQYAVGLYIDCQKTIKTINAICSSEKPCGC